MKALGTDYIDLYLIHWPCVEKSHPNWKEINAGTWRGFEDAYTAGKLRSIGVSNCLPEQILALEETCTVKPMVNQIEFHPGYYQGALSNWCIKHGMVVEGWSPLGCGAVLGDPTIAKLALKYGKSPAQICIRSLCSTEFFRCPSRPMRIVLRQIPMSLTLRCLRTI